MSDHPHSPEQGDQYEEPAPQRNIMDTDDATQDDGSSGEHADVGRPSKHAASQRPRGPERPAVSEKQLAANYRNAQRSTGPRTVEGKARSSQNRVFHGVFMESYSAIARGRFQEDVNEVAGYVDAIVCDLGPRDQLEYCEARRVAQLALLRLLIAGRG